MKTNYTIYCLLLLALYSCNTSKKAISTKEGSEKTTSNIVLESIKQESQEEQRREIENILTQIFATGDIFLHIVEQCTTDSNKTQHKQKETHLQASFVQNTNRVENDASETSAKSIVQEAENKQEQATQEQEHKEKTTTKTTTPVYLSYKFYVLILTIILIILFLRKIKSFINIVKFIVR